MDNISRRHFIKLTGGAVTVAGLGITGLAGTASPKAEAATHQSHPKLDSAAPLPKAKGQRAVVVGGGWSGLTAASLTNRSP